MIVHVCFIYACVMQDLLRMIWEDQNMLEYQWIVCESEYLNTCAFAGFIC